MNLLSKTLRNIYCAFSKTARFLNNTRLFDNFSFKNFRSLCQRSNILTVNPRTQIITKGEVADKFYLILKGHVKVFLTNDKNEETVLARLVEGDYFGEQALLSGEKQKRNANVTALTKTKLLTVSYNFLKKALTQNEKVNDYLQQTNKNKLVDHLKHHTPIDSDTLYDAFKDLDGQVITGHMDDIIFNKGDQSDSVYFIIDGSVHITLSKTDSVELTKGQIFGELGVLRNSPRAGAATFKNEGKLLKIPDIIFTNLYESVPELQDFVAAIQRIYNVPSRGFVSVNMGTLENLPAIKTTFDIKNHVITALHTINNEIFNMHIENIKPDRIITYEPDISISREIGLQGNNIVAIKSSGEWDSLGHACGLLLDNNPISQSIIDLFVSEGKLSAEEEFTHNRTICYCMKVSSDTILKCISDGVNTAEKIGQTIGAGRVCGGCIPRIKVLLGQQSWLLATMAFVKKIGEHASLFRVWKQGKVFTEALPGQFINIRFLIDGNWVERSYTVVSKNEKKNYYDIAIKLEEKGYVTPWLFKQDDEIIVRISKPEGHFTLPKSIKREIVFFAAGIGITPAEAFLHQLEKSNWNREFFLDYSVHSKSDSYFYDELKKAADDESHNFHTDLHVTSEERRVNEDDVLKMVKRHPDADYYICGGKEYAQMVLNTLKKAGIPDDRIKVEYFKVQELE